MIPAPRGSHAPENAGMSDTAAYDAAVRGEAWLNG
jgi:hypothetical protein